MSHKKLKLLFFQIISMRSETNVATRDRQTETKPFENDCITFRTSGLMSRLTRIASRTYVRTDMYLALCPCPGGYLSKVKCFILARKLAESIDRETRDSSGDDGRTGRTEGRMEGRTDGTDGQTDRQMWLAARLCENNIIQPDS
jgi:hypothetical protein